ncbi:4-(cytidine 5'-diphospho)-2-C-methyl-D-erythritol kinase [Paraphotobacterium marinum]
MYSKSVTLRCPAKLNLFLNINKRYDNGYHELQTLFQMIDVEDEITFKFNSSKTLNFKSNLPELSNSDNLIIKSIQLIERTFNLEPIGLDIYLKKNIPIGGGLGGGSSNAATTLLFLDTFLNLRLSQDQLIDLGRNLGADVPFFILGENAIGEGIGEKLTPVKLPNPFYIVIKPNQSVSTAQIFNHTKLKRDTPKKNITQLMSSNFKNDCEPVVRSLYNNVDKSLTWLLQYTRSNLSGTGACVFGEAFSEQHANEIKDNLPEEWIGFVTKGLSSSPTKDKLNQLKLTFK